MLLQFIINGLVTGLVYSLLAIGFALVIIRCISSTLRRRASMCLDTTLSSMEGLSEDERTRCAVERIQVWKANVDSVTIQDVVAPSWMIC